MLSHRLLNILLQQLLVDVFVINDFLVIVFVIKYTLWIYAQVCSCKITQKLCVNCFFMYTVRAQVTPNGVLDSP